MNNKETKSFNLKRSAQPYIALPIIILLIAVFWICYVIRTKDWGPLEALGALMIVATIIAWYGTRYRISWHDGEIVQRAADGPITVIKIDHIYKIEQETSDIKTLLRMRRPSRRVTIYGRTSHGMQKIDVSLKHFKREDVKKLMRGIHELRPDLKMPENWV